MSDSLEFRLDTRAFEKALLALYGATWRDLSELLKEMAKGFIKQVVLITPPGGGGVTGPAARRRGAAHVATDVNRVFRELRHEKWHSPEIKKAIRERDLARLREIVPHIPEFAGMQVELEPNPAYHRAARNSRGVVPQGTRQRVLVLDGLKKYIKIEQARVGKLASGWNAAAEKLGVNLPAWVTRHGAGRGSIVLELREPSLTIRITNAVRYAQHISDLQRRIQWALDRQASGTEKRVAKILEAAARKASLKA
ncbi:hypothetical protein DB346_05510 [Verrucomicrobia bacterium LW23]|nr:hypothetical protein DB346_05510 [Verrucomicrobia bacterium LW23]